MKQDAVLTKYKAVVEAFEAADQAVRDMLTVLPEAEPTDGEAPHKMMTADMNKCLTVYSIHFEDARLRVKAVFEDMIRYSEEVVAQAMAHKQSGAKGPPTFTLVSPEAGNGDK